MVSRRKFLQTNLAGLALPLGAAGVQAQARPTGTETASAATTTERDYWNDWPNYLTAKVNAARARRKAALAAVSTASQVQDRIQKVRARVWELIGGPLEKTPLNPTTVGTLDRKAYRIEKVIFESQPQVYVTAHLYVPGDGKPPFPGILAPLGHAREGKAYRNYQYLFQTLARKGYVVLAFDPFGQGERQQFLDPRTGRSRYGPTGEHDHAGNPLLLLGATFAQYRVWDGIRALDYLLSRPEVDPHRIGCTGHSGGGTMTMYLAALEPRIQAAVEAEGNSEDVTGPSFQAPGAVDDAEQNLVGSLAEDQAPVDRTDLLLAFAPKPLLIIYTPQDVGTTYSQIYEEGTKEMFEAVRQAYNLLGAEEKAGLFASPLPHDYDVFSRRAAYDWFNHWFGKKEAGTEEAEFDASPAEALNCTSTGQVLTSLGGRSVLQVNIDRAKALIPRRPFAGPAGGWEAARQRLRTNLRALLALPSAASPLDARTLSSAAGKGLVVEEFEFRSEPGMRVPGWFVKPGAKPGPFPTVLYLSEQGREAVVGEPNEMEALVRRGFALCAIDLRGQGISTPRFPSGGPLYYGESISKRCATLSLVLGKPLLGQRVADFLRCLDYLEARPDVNPARIHVLGVAGSGLVALLGTALDERPKSILLGRVLADFHSVVESEKYGLEADWFVFGFLREFDLPDVVAALAPRKCWLFNATSAQGEALPELETRSRYPLASQAYSEQGRPAGLRFLVQPDQQLPAVTQPWLENS